MIYKIKKLIKSIFYIFVTKKMLVSIIIFLFFLLLGKNVFAYGFNSTATVSDDVLSALKEISYYYNDDYYCIYRDARC